MIFGVAIGVAAGAAAGIGLASIVLAPEIRTLGGAMRFAESLGAGTGEGGTTNLKLAACVVVALATAVVVGRIV